MVNQQMDSQRHRWMQQLQQIWSLSRNKLSYNIKTFQEIFLIF